MGTAGKTIRLYLTILKRYRASSVLMLLLIIISVVSVDILAPYYVAQILDTLTEVAANRDDVETAERLFVSFLVVSLIGMVTWRFFGFWAARRQAGIVHRLEQVVFERLTLHSYAFFADRFGGALVTQSNRFVRSYQYLEDIFHFEVLPLIIRLLISVSVMMASVPSIGLALLIWSGFFIASVTWMVAKKQPYTRQASATDTFITARLADVLANILNLKSFGKRSDEVDSFRGFERQAPPYPKTILDHR